MDTMLSAPPDRAVRPGPHTGPERPVGRPLVVAADLTRRWGQGPTAQLGIDRVDLSIAGGELVAIVGPSGSGKSTLGALLAGIDRPTAGSLVVDGARIDQYSDERLARWRAANVGIVFQEHHLLPTLDAGENVELALRFHARRIRRRERRRRSDAALEAVGLGAKARRLPAELSGGERQRVAVARALATQPSMLVADEPTGSLDQRSGSVVFDLLAAAADRGTTVVLITHDDRLADRADRVVSMLDGRIVEER